MIILYASRPWCTIRNLWRKKKTFEDLLFLFSLPAGGNIVYAALPVLQSKKRVHWNQQFILYLTAPLLVLFF